MSKTNSACPFCGGKVDPTGWFNGAGKRGPECEGCRATAPSLEVWNRAGEPVALPARESLNGRLPGHEAIGWNACLDEISKLGPLYTHADPAEVERLRDAFEEGFSEGVRCADNNLPFHAELESSWQSSGAKKFARAEPEVKS